MIGIILVQLYWINSSFIKTTNSLSIIPNKFLIMLQKKLDDKEVIDFTNVIFK